MHYFIGIDLGTSGIRAIAIDEQAQPLAMTSCALPASVINGNTIEQDANLWWQGVTQVLDELLAQLDRNQVQAMCVDGTSGTLLATDAEGNPLAPALMYNDSRARDEADRIRQTAPANSPAQGASSGLAKILYLQKQFPNAAHFLHQADWIAGKLCGSFNLSDENNALKSGYDVLTRRWPDWLQPLNVRREYLPKVLQPGDVFGSITPHLAKQFDLPPATQIIAGTTDSIAACIATGVNQPGDAVTSLGSTLVLKIISEQPVFAPEFGIYSHRLGNFWLAGGASNCGGAVLRQFFSDAQMQAMSAQLNPDQPTGFCYYPLPRTGERFPVNDAARQPLLTPRPQHDVEFFQGLLESLARIECEGYEKLTQLGATAPRRVVSAGGGSRNPAWTQIRAQQLNLPVTRADHDEACYGSAVLALRSHNAAQTATQTK